MKFEITRTEEDALKELKLTKLLFRRMKPIYMGSMILFTSIFIISSNLMVALILSIVFLSIQHILLKMRLLKQLKLNGYIGTLIYEITDQFISIQSDSNKIKGEFYWDHIKEVTEKDSVIYLKYINDNFMYFDASYINDIEFLSLKELIHKYKDKRLFNDYI